MNLRCASKIGRLGAATAAALALQVAPAQAAPETAAAADVHLFAGPQYGGGLGFVAADRAWGVELTQSWMLHNGPALSWEATELAGTVRLMGDAARSLGARVGYQLAVFNYDLGGSGRDVNHSVDVGLVATARSQRGHSISLEAGPESVLRADSFQCCDHARLRSFSLGVRVVLTGEVALTPAAALFAQLGARTADHVEEISFLPLALAGLVLRL